MHSIAGENRNEGTTRAPKRPIITNHIHAGNKLINLIFPSTSPYPHPFLSYSNMTNGYETDDTQNSSKRRRRGDDVDAASTTPPPQGGQNNNPDEDDIPTTPFVSGEAVFSSYVESLDDELRSLFRKHAHAVLQAFASHYNANAKFEKERDDDGFVPQSCRHVLTLQPKAVVQKDDRFSDLLRETDEVVREAELLMKKQFMKCRGMNVESLHFDIARNFAIALPEIAKLQLASDDMSEVSPHLIVADLLTNQKESILSFLGVTEDKLSQLYCEAHGLDNFPTPSDPPLFVDPSLAVQPMASALRGRSGREVINPYAQRGGSGRRSPVTPATTQRQQNAPESALQGVHLDRERLTTIANMDQGIFTQASTNEFSYGGGEEAKSTDADATNTTASRRSVGFVGEGERTNDGASATINDGGEENINNRDETMNEETEDGGDAGRQQQQQPPHAQNVTPLAQQNVFQTAANMQRRERLKKVHHKMVRYVDNLFVRPRIEYRRRVDRNAQRMRVKIAEKELKKVSMADKVADAVQKEGSTTPRTIKVLITDGIEKAMEKKSKGQNSKPSPSSKTLGGPNSKGAPVKKRNLLLRPRRIPTRTLQKEVRPEAEATPPRETTPRGPGRAPKTDHKGAARARKPRKGG